VADAMTVAIVGSSVLSASLISFGPEKRGRHFSAYGESPARG